MDSSDKDSVEGIQNRLATETVYSTFLVMSPFKAIPTKQSGTSRLGFSLIFYISIFSMYGVIHVESRIPFLFDSHIMKISFINSSPKHQNDKGKLR